VPVVGDLVEAVFAEGCWVTATVLGLRARQVQVEFDMLEPEPARALVAGPHYFCDENDMPKDVARSFGLSPALVLALNAPHYPGLTTSSRLRQRTLLALPHAIACSENETPRTVASAFSLDLEALLAYNKEFVPAITASSKLHESTLLLLPPGSKPPSPPKGAPGPMPYLAATVEVPAAGSGGSWRKAEVCRLLSGLRFSLAPEGTDGLADVRLRDEGKTWRWPGGVRPALFGVADGANGAARRPIAVGDIVDVEVEEEEKTRWRAAEVRRVFEDGRFCVCVDGDEEFVEVYSPDDEGTEWRWPPAGRRKAREWVATSFTRPRPPSVPELFLEAAAGGGTVQVFQDGGWWQAGLADDDLLLKPLEAPTPCSPGGTAASSEAGPSTAPPAPADGATTTAAADAAAAPADAPPPPRPSVYVFTLTRNTHAPLRIGTERVRPDWEFKEAAWRVVPPPPRAPRMIQTLVPDERPVPSVRREVKEQKPASPVAPAPVVASLGGGPSSLGSPVAPPNAVVELPNPVVKLVEPLSSWAWARAGTQAEACLAAPAARGAWWAVRLLELQPQSALVSYEAFAERDGVAARLQEWVPWARVRPRPPSAPADFLDATLAGEAVQVWWEDGWWDATLLEQPVRREATLAAAAEAAEASVLLVRAAGLPSEPQAVACHRLRPGWQWRRLSGSEGEGEWLAPCIAPVGLLSPRVHPGDIAHADEARRDAA